MPPPGGGNRSRRPARRRSLRRPWPDTRPATREQCRPPDARCLAAGLPHGETQSSRQDARRRRLVYTEAILRAPRMHRQRSGPIGARRRAHVAAGTDDERAVDVEQHRADIRHAHEPRATWVGTGMSGRLWRRISSAYGDIGDAGDCRRMGWSRRMSRNASRMARPAGSGSSDRAGGFRPATGTRPADACRWPPVNNAHGSTGRWRDRVAPRIAVNLSNRRELAVSTNSSAAQSGLVHAWRITIACSADGRAQNQHAAR